MRSDIFPATNNLPGKVLWHVKQSQIRYAVLCYGVPLRIEEDPNLKEAISPTVKQELRRNGAAVDSELALLPLIEQKLPLTGPIGNNYYTSTNAARLQATNGAISLSSTRNSLSGDVSLTTNAAGNFKDWGVYTGFFATNADCGCLLFPITEAAPAKGWLLARDGLALIAAMLTACARRT